jgi:hypothetical protein
MFSKIITLLIIIILLPTTNTHGEDAYENSIPLIFEKELNSSKKTDNTPQIEEPTTKPSEEINNTPQIEEPTIKTPEEEKIIDTNTIETEQKEIEPKTEYKGYDYKSLVFSEDEMLKLIGILTAKKIKTETTISALEVTDEQKVTTTIFLNSIMYLSQDSWTIWINEKKISNYEKDSGDLKVLKITSDNVKFLWVVSKTKWDIMMPNFNFENSISKINENNEIETIFTLSPNQSFLPETGEIVEGKVKIEEKTVKEETTTTEESSETQTTE